MAARRQRVLETALELLSENDGHFTMRDLASRSDVALGTLYNLFGSQDALLAEAVADVFERRVAPEVIQPEGDDIYATLSSWYEGTFKEVMRLPVFAKAMAHIYFNGEPDDRVRQMLHQVPRRFVKAQIERVKAAGDLVDWADPGLLADEMTASSYAAVSRWAAGDLTDSELRDETWRINCTFLAGATMGRTHRVLTEALRARAGIKDEGDARSAS